MPWYFGGMAPTAARRAKLVQRSSFRGLQGNPDACHPRRGVVGPSYGSFASGQARKLIPSAGPLLPLRHCDSRAEVARQSRRSFFPARFIRHRRRFAGKLSPPNPLRWASAGAPVTASASQWGGRQCTAGLCPIRTAHRRQQTPYWGAGVEGAGGAFDENPCEASFLKRRKAPRPFFPPISSGRNGGPGRVGPRPRGHPRQVDGAPRSSRPTGWWIRRQAGDHRSPLRRRHKLRIARFAASGKARSLHCASSPHDDHSVGSPRGPHWAGGWYPPLRAWQLSYRPSRRHAGDAAPYLP